MKLGTITKDGTADVFSYDEDDMVEDPNLAVHLAHFGINITQMEKVSELSLFKVQFEWLQGFGNDICFEILDREINDRARIGFKPEDWGMEYMPRTRKRIDTGLRSRSNRYGIFKFSMFLTMKNKFRNLCMLG